MKQLIFIMSIAISINAYAQDNNTVTLVASGQGKTKDEAKQNALRSAIEQAFGTFISSKTEIFNDNLVKDEIVSVSNGNIQNYEIISEVQIPNGDFATSLKANVSVTKLTSFVESKGIVAEFKGSILAVNVKQQILNEQNEIKSIGNIVKTCKEILDHSCDFMLVRGEPKQKNNNNNSWAIPITINVKFNKNVEQFYQYLLNSIMGLSMSKDEVLKYNQLGKETYKIALGDTSNMICGSTNNIELIESLGKSNKALGYKIMNGKNVEFESENYEEIIIEFKKIPEYARIYTYNIQYFDKSKNSIFHFRTLTSIISIIDIITYLKHSLLNFEISNGINSINAEKLINDKNLTANMKYSQDPNIDHKWVGKDYGFKIIEDNLNPIFNSRSQFNNFKSTSNGPKGIFSDIPTEVNLYIPIVSYDKNFYYNGGRDEKFNNVYNSKYSFLLFADNALPKNIIGNNYDNSFNGFLAVISLFDFKVSKSNISSLYFEDFLNLEEIEKVSEYKIIPK